MTHSATNQPALVIRREIEVERQMHPITETVTTEGLLNLISDLVGDTCTPEPAQLAAWRLLEKIGRR